MLEPPPHPPVYYLLRVFRDWETGMPVPDYTGPALCFFPGQPAAVLYTWHEDGERCWSATPRTEVSDA